MEFRLAESGHKLAVVMALCVACLGASSAWADGPRLPDPRLNYTLHCMGCHKPDGSGQGAFVPAIKDHMARFLALPEGRDYLVRVPGTAQSMLTDGEVADLLNWMVARFDPQHIPNGFMPYRADEVAELRRNPISAPSSVRARLVKELSARY